MTLKTSRPPSPGGTRLPDAGNAPVSLPQQAPPGVGDPVRQTLPGHCPPFPPGAPRSCPESRRRTCSRQRANRVLSGCFAPSGPEVTPARHGRNPTALRSLSGGSPGPHRPGTRGRQGPTARLPVPRHSDGSQAGRSPGDRTAGHAAAARETCDAPGFPAGFLL